MISTSERPVCILEPLQDQEVPAMRPITALRAEGLPIGELSRLTGVKIETIRYYEKIKLLPPPPRTARGRRSYGSDHVARLRFIRRAREVRFGLADIRTLLALGESGQASCATARDIASAHLANIRAKLADLARLEGLLAGTVARCSGKPVPICPVLDMLDMPGP